MRVGELGAGGFSIGAVAAALVLPKCPLCIAGFLSALGCTNCAPRASVGDWSPGTGVRQARSIAWARSAWPAE